MNINFWLAIPLLATLLYVVYYFFPKDVGTNSILSPLGDVSYAILFFVLLLLIWLTYFKTR